MRIFSAIIFYLDFLNFIENLSETFTIVVVFNTKVFDLSKFNVIYVICAAVATTQQHRNLEKLLKGNVEIFQILQTISFSRNFPVVNISYNLMCIFNHEIVVRHYIGLYTELCCNGQQKIGNLFDI